MKKKILKILVICSVFFLVGCGKKSDKENSVRSSVNIGQDYYDIQFNLISLPFQDGKWNLKLSSDVGLGLSLETANKITYSEYSTKIKVGIGIVLGVEIKMINRDYSTDSISNYDF